MSDIQFKDEFVAFVDILGWKEKIETAERGTGMSLAELIDLAKRLGTQRRGIPQIFTFSACKTANLKGVPEAMTNSKGIST